MIVAGIMSGTSADGINIALVDFSSQKGSRLKLVGFAEFPYPKDVRRAVLQAMNAQSASVAELARLNFLLAELYADAVLSTQRRFKRKAKLIGCHGQTLYHQGEKARYLGKNLAVTWQTGEGATLAARTRVPVVSDFRPADMAAGGLGAPLVPYLDFLLYKSERVGRIAQNIGGIANLTAIPAGAKAAEVRAFDTGPGNMVIDAVTDKLFSRPFDRNGEIAASGRVLDNVLKRELRNPFFRRKPPKTAGREEFGREFVGDFLKACSGSRKEDAVATATALTAASIAHAIRDFVLGSGRKRFHEVVASGGGTSNSTLMAMLANELSRLGLQLRSADEFGIPSEAKEAVAFALLAYETWHQRPSNVPSATGARRPAILGKISYV
jgi:anhydro-N-acetylmuramic acid kinase